MAKTLTLVGFWAFILGLVIAVVAGVVAPGNAMIALVLVVLGIIIGCLNITVKETVTLLLAIVTLVVAGNAFAAIKWAGVGAILGSMLAYVATLMAPAGVIVAVKALWQVGKPGD